VEPKNDQLIQPELTPEAANPPPEKPKVKPDAGKWNVIPEEILPPEETPLLTGSEAKEKRRKEYLKNGSAKE
jgi:hypothetical protein